MNSKIIPKVVFGFLCVIALTIPLGYAIKCYGCTGKEMCDNPLYVECSAWYANQTVLYMGYFFQNVTAIPSNSFDCIRMELNYSLSSEYYKGCIYSTMQGCEYTMKTNFTPPTRKKCFQCNDFSGCNPADRSYLSVAALVVPLLCVLKFVVQ